MARYIGLCWLLWSACPPVPLSKKKPQQKEKSHHILKDRLKSVYIYIYEILFPLCQHYLGFKMKL